MHYFIKNTRNLVILSFLLLAIFAALGYFSLSLNAQSLPFDPKEKAEESAKSYAEKQAEDLFKTTDIEKIAYPDDKNGCGMKSTMFVIMSGYYASGKSVEEIANNKITVPLIESIYKRIKKNGIEEATLNNMKEYKKCVANAKANKDPSREYDMSLKHDACAQLNDAILDTLEAIKRRKSLNRIVDKYGKEQVDFSGTILKDLQNPILLFVNQLYKASKTKEYKDIVTMGAGFSVACSA